ncbi:MAG: hypothetical protein ABI051_04410 [Vicinamibacterales bacterium]
MKPHTPVQDREPRSTPVLFGPDGRELPPATWQALRDGGPAPAPSPPSTPEPLQVTHHAALTPQVPHAQPVRNRVIHVVEKVHHWLEAAQIPIHGLGFLLVWWRKLGTVWMTALLLGLSAPVGGYSVLSYATTHSIPDWIGDFGVQFEAREWSVHPFSLTAEAHDVIVRRDAHSDPVLRATSVEFSGSIGTLLNGLFRRGAVYNEILVRHGELRLEQSLTGDWNWVEFLEGVPAERRQDALEGLYQIKEFRLEDMKVVYTEHVPGNSGGGVIQTAQATIYIDDVNGRVTDLKRAGHGEAYPTGFQFKARTADGVIEMKGNASLFAADAPSFNSAHVAQVSLGPTGAPHVAAPGGPMFSMKLYLENIGVGAYARMVPTTTILPVKGTLRGNIELVRSIETAGVVCRANVAAEDVQFAPNPRMVPVREQFDQIERQLVGYRVTGPYDPCQLPGRGDTKGAGAPSRSGTGSGLLAAFNVQATKNAPVGVRAITAFDQQTLAGGLASGVLADISGRLGNQMAGEVSKLLGPRSGAAMHKALVADGVPTGSQSPSNPVSTGVKSVGRGLKRLFGGKKSSK